jgi:drug/metabolite transporter (DMT)-like permease
MPQLLAAIAAICFGTAVVTSRFGLRTIDPRTGAAISIPVAMLALIAASPVMLEISGFELQAAMIFTAVGFLFPALVTILRFQATELLGPTTTSTIVGTSPLFAVGAAVIWLDEVVPGRAFLAALGTVTGIAVLSWRTPSSASSWRVWWLTLPIAAALITGCAQTMIKSGLSLWANPFAATLIAYAASSVTVMVVFLARNKGFHGNKVSAQWLAFTGVLNSIGVLSTYAALNSAPVFSVAPIVAAYPLVTLVLSAAILREERIGIRAVAGALLTVSAIGYLVSI